MMKHLILNYSNSDKRKQYSRKGETQKNCLKHCGIDNDWCVFQMVLGYS